MVVGSHLVNSNLRLLALRHSGIDLYGSLFGGLKTFDERNIGQDILWCVGKTFEKLILELHELDLVLLERLYQLLLPGFKIRLLFVDHLREEHDGKRRQRSMMVFPLQGSLES